MRTSTRCAGCGWPVVEGTALSRHHTSDGWLDYRRCVCGAVHLTLDGAPFGTAWRPYTTAS